MENIPAGPAVTKVVDRIPREGMDAQLEQAMKNLIAAALKFPGHLGVTVTRPFAPGAAGIPHGVPLRFLRAPARVGRVGEHARLGRRRQPTYTQGEPHYDILTGLDPGSTLPAQPAMHPKRIRMTVVTWMGIFPLVYLYAELFNRILPPATPVISQGTCGDRARRADHELRGRAAAHPAVQGLALSRAELINSRSLSAWRALSQASPRSPLPSASGDSRSLRSCR